jgi:magnesium-transporting ATPase (P-type)
MARFFTMIFDDVPISGFLILIALFVLAIAGIIFVRLKSRLTGNSTAGPSSAKTAESWHALDSAEVMTRLGTSHDGLGDEEVKHSLAKYGPNRLPEPKKRGPLLGFLVQFHNLLIYVLLVASGVTAMLGHWVDTGVILGVVVVNALIGFVQEDKAENALRAIRRMLSPQAMVLRSGRRVTLPAEELVPGDMVLLQSGDKVPADLRLIRVKDLQVQEAVLTGESVAVEKQVEVVADDAVLGDRRSIAYSSTLVTYGQGAGVVVATGVNTEIGRISAMLEHVETLTTPLLRQMGQFARWLTGAIISIAAATFAFGVLFRAYSATDMFLAAVGLAVAAIPEGLPAIMTITLAIGVQSMNRHPDAQRDDREIGCHHHRPVRGRWRRLQSSRGFSAGRQGDPGE